MDKSLNTPEIEALFSNKLSSSVIYNKILDSISDGVCIFELRDTIHALYLNKQYYNTIKYTEEEYARYISDVTSTLFPNDAEQIIKKAALCHKNGEVFYHDFKGFHSDKSVGWFQVKATCVDFIKSEYPVFLALVSDISKHKMLKHNLAVDNARYRIFEETTESILFDYIISEDRMNFSYNEVGKIRRWTITDYKKSPSLIHPKDREKFHRALFAACCRPVKGELEYRTKAINSEKYLWCKTYYSSIADDTGTVTNVLGRLQNIDHEILTRNDIIKKSENDSLTGVYNRLVLEQKIVERISNCEGIMYFAVIDIDNFKKFNDTYGHIFGDNVLVTVSQKLLELFPNGIVGRFGGDEFIVYSDLDNDNSIYKKFKKLSDETYCLKNNNKVNITFSIGVAFSFQKICYTQLLAKADKIMYTVKKNGKNNTILQNID